MDERFEIVVIGTGFAGIGMGVRLRAMGITNFAILEREQSVGGTWRDNHYPGAACDVQSHLYSFSFAPNPRWSRSYAEQPEILEYLNEVTDRYDVRQHIRFGCRVVALEWNERRCEWRVDCEDGRSFTCKAVVMGNGGLSQPSIPEIPGQAEFKGPTFHTARWDKSFDLRGKRVAVIGTGASAIQVVPAIAPKVAELKLFQRTPPWVMPRGDRAISEGEQRMFAALPFTQRLARSRLLWLSESRVLAFVVRPKLMEYARKEALAFIRQQVRDPELRRKITPNYSFGCKRVLLSDDYYPALQRDNVEVVTDGIERIDAHGVVTRDGVSRPVDAIVYATGFHVNDRSNVPFDVRGRGGCELRELWRDGAEAYLGVSVSGFPNLFLIAGPNTGLGHSSMVLMIESAIEYIAGALIAMRERNLATLDVSRTVQEAFNRKLHARLSTTIWATGGCKSWYQTEAGKITALWPGTTGRYRRMTEHFDLAKYDVTLPTVQPVSPAELSHSDVITTL